MKTTCLLFILAATVAAVAQKKEEKKSPSPPEIYQAFLVALVNGDKTTVERLAIPNKDLTALTSTPVPAQHREQAIAEIKAAPYRILKVGEVVQLPNGRMLGPTEESEKKGWVMIANDSDPIPHMLQKSGDGWKVDAGDLTAARKAAAKQRK